MDSTSGFNGCNEANCLGQRLSLFVPSPALSSLLPSLFVVAELWWGWSIAKLVLDSYIESTSVMGDSFNANGACGDEVEAGDDWVGV